MNSECPLCGTITSGDECNCGGGNEALWLILYISIGGNLARCTYHYLAETREELTEFFPLFPWRDKDGANGRYELLRWDDPPEAARELVKGRKGATKCYTAGSGKLQQPQLPEFNPHDLVVVVKGAHAPH